jgi:hypothetical protein
VVVRRLERAMHGHTEVRIIEIVAWCAFAAICSLSVGCGSHVVLAEAKHEDASRAGDGGEPRGNDVDGGDATHITLCGKSRCKDLSVVIPGSGTVTGYACCVDPARSTCGVVEVTECVELNYPGHVDPTCHSPLSSLDFPGCCRPDGTCGVLDTQYGLGCAQLPFVPSSLAGTCVY